MAGGQTLEEVAQRVYGVSILRDIQNLAEQGPGQPALPDPALSRGFGIEDPQRCLQPHWFCNFCFPTAKLAMNTISLMRVLSLV